MSRLKKGASHYNKAVTRLAALKSIDKNMDLGNGITITTYEAAIRELRDIVDDYNTFLSTLDEKLNRVRATEKKLKDFSERMLTGVATCFGKDSDEYVMAGGVKKSDRKKRSFTKKKEAA